MYLNQIAAPGLGCLSYVIGCPRAKIMAVVDPKRDVKDYLRIDREEGMQITRVFNTHLHADHVSGDQELWLTTGADIYIHESAPDSDQPAVRQRLPVEHRGKPCEAVSFLSKCG